MGWNFRSATSGGDNSLGVNNVNAGLPAGTSSGDWQEIWVGCGVLAPANPPAITTPVGWTNRGTSAVISLAGGVINITLTLFTKVAGGSEGVENLATAGAVNAAITFVRKSSTGQDSVSPFGQVVFSTATGGPSTSAVVDSITTTENQANLSIFVAQGTAQGITPPQGTDERADNATFGISSFDEIFSIANSTGTRTFTLPTSTTYAFGIAEYHSTIVDRTTANDCAWGGPLAAEPRSNIRSAYRKGLTPFDLKGAQDLAVTENAVFPPGSTTPTGTLAVTLGNDTLVATGTPINVATLSRTLQNDTLAATGSPVINASLNRTLGNDTLAATATPVVVGTLSRTLANDTLSATGSVGAAATGNLAATLNNDTLSATATPVINASLSRTLGNDTLSASGTPVVVGTLSRTLGNDTLSATGSVGTASTGNLAATLGNDTLAANGTPVTTGNLNVTLNGATVVATATPIIVGNLGVTLGNDTLNATGSPGTPVVATQRWRFLGLPLERLGL